MNRVKTPYFQLYRKKLNANLEKLTYIERKTGVKILHTLKSFNHSEVTPLIASALSGMSVSSSLEIKMAQKAKSKSLHLYAPAFKASEFKELAQEVNSISLNSISQWQQFGSGDFSPTPKSLGLRINPKLQIEIPNYCNPNLAHSRLGVDYQEFQKAYISNPKQFHSLKGLHFHALFRSQIEALEILLDHIINNYQAIIPQLEWINLGGGHNLTDDDYDIKRFFHIIYNFQAKFPHVQLYLEPGEAVLKECGEFVASILDIITIEHKKIAILDTSIETHLLDVAIVNQRLKIKGAKNHPTPYVYELTGNSCLQGDIIGQYAFSSPLKVGDEIIFEDMMSYTLVKMTQFNGIKPPNMITSL